MTLTWSSEKIGMDGNGRWIDNVFIERLWRFVKYEEVYLRAYADEACFGALVAATPKAT